MQSDRSNPNVATALFEDWNILSSNNIKNVASNAPTTVEELSALGVLGENIVQEYGERLVHFIKKFVNDNKLQEYLIRRPLKRPKRSTCRADLESPGTALGKTPDSKPAIKLEDDKISKTSPVLSENQAFAANKRSSYFE